MQTQNTINGAPNALIGSFRRFGAYGPAYEILGLAADEKTKDTPTIHFNVRVVDSGENIRYPYQDALNDPEA